MRKLAKNSYWIRLAESGGAWPAPVAICLLCGYDPPADWEKYPDLLDLLPFSEQEKARRMMADALKDIESGKLEAFPIGLTGEVPS